MEKKFTVHWADELGEGWMNADNLRLCLFSKEHIGGRAQDLVMVTEDKEPAGETIISLKKEQ